MRFEFLLLVGMSVLNSSAELILESLNILLVKRGRMSFLASRSSLLCVVASQLVNEQSVFHSKVVFLRVLVAVQLTC